jgi:large conductance mechanosensitive channel
MAAAEDIKPNADKRRLAIVRSGLTGFLDFLGKQGLIGLAVGFLLGSSVAKAATALITDIINPLLGLFFSVQNLKDIKFTFGGTTLLWGDFLSNLLDLAVVVLVAYLLIKLFHREKKEQ